MIRLHRLFRMRIVLLILAGVAGVTGCQAPDQTRLITKDQAESNQDQGASAKEGQLHVGYGVSGAALQAMVLQDEGALAEGLSLKAGGVRSVTWHEEASSNAIVSGLTNHTIDIAYLDPVFAMNASVASKGEVVIIAGVSSGGGVLLGRKDVPFASVKDLDQKTIAVEETGSVLEMLLEKQMKEVGLKAAAHGGTVRVEPLSVLQMREGFKSGTLEGAVVSADVAALLIQYEGVKIWMDPGTLYPEKAYPLMTLVTTRHSLEADPQGLQAFLREHMRVSDTMHEKALTTDSTAASALKRKWHIEPEAIISLNLNDRMTFSWNPQNKEMVQLIYLGLEMKAIKEEPKSDGFFRLEVLSQLMKERQ